MSNAAGDVWISYNGEVYDWAADAKVLTMPVTCFARTRTPNSSSTPTSIGAFDFIARLRGMFALAICDLKRRAVFVVRDRTRVEADCLRASRRWLCLRVHRSLAVALAAARCTRFFGRGN
jgi:asparagine synthetase B (glutamine-hydrolysing)